MATMVLFSAVEGTVLKEGVPISGASVEREFRWGWKDETGTDTATTDAAGKFTLPVIKRSSILGGLLPHEPMIRQTILIRHDGTTYKAWMFDKGNYDLNGELKGRPIRIACRLEAPLHHSGDVYGICDLI